LNMSWAYLTHIYMYILTDSQLVLLSFEPWKHPGTILQQPWPYSCSGNEVSLDPSVLFDI
jgi:hypothetical protein